MQVSNVQPKKLTDSELILQDETKRNNDEDKRNR